LTRYMLDTNIVSDLIRNPQGKVAKRIAKLGEGNICTSVIVAAELRYGCAKSGSKRLLKAVEDLLGWEFVHVCIDDHSPTRRPIVQFPSSRRPWLITKASASPSPAS
jgi:predicted nucleic acid-binding protein